MRIDRYYTPIRTKGVRLSVQEGPDQQFDEWIAIRRRVRDAFQHWRPPCENVWPVMPQSMTGGLNVMVYNRVSAAVLLEHCPLQVAGSIIDYNNAPQELKGAVLSNPLTHRTKANGSV